MGKKTKIEEANPKKRAPNFSNEEVRALIKLVLKKASIIENKTTDAQTWKSKNDAWGVIAGEFNASNTGNIFRSMEALRSKYERVKKELKKKVTKNRTETFKTGGGVPAYVEIEDVEKDLLKIISVNVSGLPDEFGSDAILPKTTITGERLISEVLQNSKCNNYGTDGIENMVDVELNQSLTTYYAEEIENIIVLPASDDDIDKTEPGSSAIESIEGVSNSGPKKQPTENHRPNWNTWTPSTLKSKKASSFEYKKKEDSKQFINAKLNDLINSKVDVVFTQKEMLLKDEERKVKEHEARMEKMEIEKDFLRQQHFKKMEIFNVELELKRRQLLL